MSSLDVDIIPFEFTYDHYVKTHPMDVMDLTNPLDKYKFDLTVYEYLVNKLNALNFDKAGIDICNKDISDECELQVIKTFTVNRIYNKIDNEFSQYYMDLKLIYNHRCDELKQNILDIADPDDDEGFCKYKCYNDYIIGTGQVDPKFIVDICLDGTGDYDADESIFRYLMYTDESPSLYTKTKNVLKGFGRFNKHQQHVKLGQMTNCSGHYYPYKPRGSCFAAKDGKFYGKQCCLCHKSIIRFINKNN
jgi:hypothetical protein